MTLIPKLSIAQKLPLALVLSAIVVGAGVGAASYVIASQALETQARQNLATIAFERANQVSATVKGIEADLVKTANSDSTASAMRAFAGAWQQAQASDGADGLKQIYVSGNPNPPADRMLLDMAATTLSYGTWHAKYQPVFRGVIQASGYRDLYLFDLTGNLIYSTAKRDDFATNFAEGGGAYASSGLGTAYRQALAIETPGDFVFADFSLYAADPGQPVAFLAKPVFDAQSHKIGVMAVAIPDSLLNNVISYRQGLGATGDTILVGLDGLARSDSTLTKEDDALQPTLFNASIKDAVTGVPADTEFANFRGADVIASAAPVDVTGEQSWALVAVMSKAEIFAPVTALGTLMLAVGGVLLAGVALLGWLFARTITRPITRLTDVMGALSEGNLEVAAAGIGKHDEVGKMARAVEIFRENAIRVGEMTEGERAGEAQRRAERADMMQRLQRSFGAVVDAAVSGDFSQRVEQGFPDAELNSLAQSVNNLVAIIDRGLSDTGAVLAALAQTDLTQRMEGDYEGALGRLRDDTNDVGERLTDVVLALRDTSRALKLATGELLSGTNDLSERTTRQAATIEETSAAMEQLASTVHDNVKRAEAASAKARSVSQTAGEGGAAMGRATEAMERITLSSGKISNIIGLIDDIAFQTNLLALNASVEAARAGEAGKGFAVVAIEVRRLAQSAARASADVKELVQQSASEVAGGTRLVGEAAQKLLAMLDSAKENSVLVDGIAAASREQASAIEEVSSAVRSLDEMTQHNAALVEETNAAIEQTEAQATELDRIVDVFTVDTDARTSELYAA